MPCGFFMQFNVMQLVTVPLILTEIPPKGMHIFVKGKIMRKRVRFLIDTGASKSVIDAGFAEEAFPFAHRKETEHLTTGLGANIPNATFITLHRIKLGSHRIKPITFALLDLSVVNSAYASAMLDPVVAIIGGDILHTYGGIINYADKILQLRID
jgi:hypothetical protein